MDLPDSFFIIHLERDPLELIVQKALIHRLQTKKSGSGLLRAFYQPPEQALIEAVLGFCRGSQTNCSRLLGINRNTLKKKISLYNIDAQKTDFSRQESFFLNFPLGREIFLSSFSAIDLLEASRAKMIFLRRRGAFLNPCLIKAFCEPVERAIIKTALQIFENRQMKTARSLGINRNTLKKKLISYGKPLTETLRGAAL